MIYDGTRLWKSAARRTEESLNFEFCVFGFDSRTLGVGWSRG